ncbi:hypothetical protein RDI58_029253 [Solanum bulbocastanum]|uniref:Uncharacterized protein n=1 Tax=Solanum bulbocastanum TaxID=147425 RepID=A0AAN8SQ12_SOLBU
MVETFETISVVPNDLAILQPNSPHPITTIMALTSHGSTDSPNTLPSLPSTPSVQSNPSKQSKLSPMRNVDQSQPRQSSPSPSLQITNIDVKIALAPIMEPLPSESTEET